MDLKKVRLISLNDRRKNSRSKTPPEFTTIVQSEMKSWTERKADGIYRYCEI